jgi:ribosome-binding protein aMBF1 (putative translation factor)
MSANPATTKDPYRDCPNGKTWSAGQPLTEEEYLEQLKARFWAKVDKTPGLGPNGECWEWRGFLHPNGYGQIIYRVTLGYQRPVNANRIAYLLTHGKFPEGFGCHSCDNPPCIRPDHIWDGTPKQNTRDAQRKGRMPTAPYVERKVCVMAKLTPEQGTLLREARKRQGFSIYVIAHDLGIHFTAYSRFENGKRGIRVERLQCLIQMLGINETAFSLKPEQHYEKPETHSPLMINQGRYFD